MKNFNNRRGLKEIYEEICKHKNQEPRHFIVKALEKIDEYLNKREKFVLILKLPTGYGKSTITRVLARSAIEGNENFSRVIHVLPMRTIVQDLYEAIKETIEEKYIAKQHMLSPGSPFFAKKCILTTLDTFILNFFKLPASEIEKSFRYETSHFEFPRAMIYTAFVIFDEFHLFSEIGSIKEERKSLTSVITAIQRLVSAAVPVLILTATLPKILENTLREYVEEVSASFEKIEFNYEEDPSFYNEIKIKKRIIKLAYDRNIEEIIEKHLDSNKRVVVVVNTVARAVELFSKFKDKAILLHGRLPEFLREELFNKIKEEVSRSGKLVISTQVIESGVNLSFDVMLTELCPIDRLVQRAGRVARFKENYGEIWIVENKSKAPYSEEALNETRKVLTDNMNLDYEKSIQLIDDVYCKIYGSSINLDLDLKRALEFLEYSPLYDSKSAKDLFEYFGGFTDNFGIISCFVKDVYERMLAIPLEERVALKFLEKSKQVLYKGKSKVLEDKDLKKLAENLSIEFLNEGYEGIVITEDIFAETTGFNFNDVYKMYVLQLENKINKLLEEGEQQEKNGNYDEALNKYKEALKLLKKYEKAKLYFSKSEYRLDLNLDYESRISQCQKKIEELQKIQANLQPPREVDIKKPCAWTFQSLESHLEGALRYAQQISPQDYSVISSRFRAVNLDIDNEKLKEMIKIVTLLHDVGKACEEYQSKFEENCNCKEPSFPLHEVPSAISLEYITKPEFSSKEKLLMKLTVLLHMNAIRGIDDIKKDLKLKYKTGWKYKAYKDKLESFLKQYKIEVTLPSQITLKDAEDFVDKIYFILNEKKREFLRLYCLMYYPLCIGDNLDAYNFRKEGEVSESRAIFIRELKEVIG